MYHNQHHKKYYAYRNSNKCYAQNLFGTPIPCKRQRCVPQLSTGTTLNTERVSLFCLVGLLISSPSPVEREAGPVVVAVGVEVVFSRQHHQTSKMSVLSGYQVVPTMTTIFRAIKFCPQFPKAKISQTIDCQGLTVHSLNI